MIVFLSSSVSVLKFILPCVSLSFVYRIRWLGGLALTWFGAFFVVPCLLLCSDVLTYFYCVWLHACIGHTALVWQPEGNAFPPTMWLLPIKLR